MGEGDGGREGLRRETRIGGDSHDHPPRDIARRARAAAGALVEVNDAASLAEAVRDWLRQPDEPQAAGQRAVAALRTAEDLPLRLAELILKEAG